MKSLIPLRLAHKMVKSATSLKWDSMRCLSLKNEKIQDIFGQYVKDFAMRQNMWSKLPFPIIGFMIRWKSSSKFGIEVENFNFFCSCFFKKTLNFSTFHSNISKSKQAIKDLIMADEEQIIYFFDIHSICEHPLKWLRKLNI